MDIRAFGFLWLVLAMTACGSGGGEAEPATTGGGQPMEADAGSDSGTPPDPTGSARVVFLGTSLTAGYGLDKPSGAYPAVLEDLWSEAGLEYDLVNAGVSGDTSAGGLARLGSILREPLAVLLVELGANDGLRGQSVDALRRNLDAIVTRTREARPEAAIVLAGMEAPPNLGPEYTADFRAVYTDLARERDLVLVPFLLEGVAGERSMNQSNGIHPNPEGHRKLADTVWEVLQGVLQDRCVKDGACDAA